MPAMSQNTPSANDVLMGGGGAPTARPAETNGIAISAAINSLPAGFIRDLSSKAAKKP